MSEESERPANPATSRIRHARAVMPDDLVAVLERQLTETLERRPELAAMLAALDGDERPR